MIPVAVITCPRSPATLPATLNSLSLAGFGPIHVSPDPQREGAYRNWKTAARFMLDTFRDSFWFLLCEDDCEFSAGMADYLQREVSGLDFRAVYSPYCAAPNQPPSGERGWVATHPRRFYGALCLLISRPLLNSFLSAGDRPGEPHGTDLALSEFCCREDVRYFVHSPSLVRHTGEVSTIFEGGNDEFRQCAEFATRI